MSAHWALAWVFIMVVPFAKLDKMVPSHGGNRNESTDESTPQSYLIAYNEDNGENMIIDEQFFDRMKKEFFVSLFKGNLPKGFNVNNKSRRSKGIDDEYNSDEEKGMRLYGFTTTEKDRVPFERHIIIVNPVESGGQRYLTAKLLKDLMFTKSPKDEGSTVTLLPDYPDDVKKMREGKVAEIRQREEQQAQDELQRIKDNTPVKQLGDEFLNFVIGSQGGGAEGEGNGASSTDEGVTATTEDPNRR